MLSVLLQLVLLLTAAAASSAAGAGSLARPGCPSKCGSITVPYPFGFDPGCYMEGFQLLCFNSRLFLNVALEITDIDISRHQIKVYAGMFSNCDRGEDNRTPAEDSAPNSGWPIDLTGLPYTLSNTENKFTAIGCSSIVYFNTTKTSNDSFGNLVAGCISVCYPGTSKTISATTDGGCSGAGCCQTTIPGGVNYFTVTKFSPMDNDDMSARTRSCSYAFLAEKNWYKFQESDLYGLNFSIRTDGKIPAVLSWSIGDVGCEEAQSNKSSYACKGANSICEDSIADGRLEGYTCRCKTDYEGNPYLEDGCQDKCGELSGCYGTCINQEGSRSCTCPQGMNGHPFVPGGCTPEPPSQRRTILLDSVCIGGGLFILLVVAMALWRTLKNRSVRKRKRKCFQRNLELLRKEHSSSNANLIERMRTYDLDELEKSTNNFDKTRIIGGGGHGHVYKGILSDQRVVAIKRPKITSPGELEQFINEVFILSQTNHRNVVTLYGCCLQTEVPLLVFEFISGGTLCNHLIDNQNYSPLSFSDRLRIATEVARALHYLHSEASITIFHRDIKSSNILLDERNHAKLADFGASRTVPLERTSITTVVQGTYGYLDPEYYQTGRLTHKSDAYSFGVIMVELLTGKIAIPYHPDNITKYLIMDFLGSVEENSLYKILDPLVLKEATKEEVGMFSEIAQICLRLNGSERPTMKEVEDKLEAIRKKRGLKGDADRFSTFGTDTSLGDTPSLERSGRSMIRPFYLEKMQNVLSTKVDSRDSIYSLSEDSATMSNPSAIFSSSEISGRS